MSAAGSQDRGASNMKASQLRQALQATLLGLMLASVFAVTSHAQVSEQDPCADLGAYRGMSDEDLDKLKNLDAGVRMRIRYCAGSDQASTSGTVNMVMGGLWGTVATYCFIACYYPIIDGGGAGCSIAATGQGVADMGVSIGLAIKAADDAKKVDFGTVMSIGGTVMSAGTAIGQGVSGIVDAAKSSGSSDSNSDCKTGATASATSVIKFVMGGLAFGTAGENKKKRRSSLANREASTPGKPPGSTSQPPMAMPLPRVAAYKEGKPAGLLKSAREGLLASSPPVRRLGKRAWIAPSQLEWRPLFQM